MSIESRATPMYRAISATFCASLCVATLALDGCHQTASVAPSVMAPAATSQAGSPAAPAATIVPPQAASASVSATPAAYELPSANALYEMVAPIALFPDKLLAQVLAASAYPDQITAADQWLAQNDALKGRALQAAVDTQAWDPSIKALTQFHSVLDQMAQNIPWSTQLGLAYANDPIDVMNAVQVMRQRASAKGALQSNAQQHVASVRNSDGAVDAPMPEIPAGQPGSVIVPPPQTIVIEPAQPNLVYVPVYNPTVIYGMPMPLYPGYVYAPPVYSEADLAATGLISFGVGVAVGAALENHYNWGWSAWGVHWNNGYAGGWVAHGGGVVFNGSPWVPHSTTIVNHVNNIHVGPDYRPHYGPHFDPNIDRHIINTAPVHRGVPLEAPRDHAIDRPVDRPIDRHIDQPIARSDSNGMVRHDDRVLTQQPHPEGETPLRNGTSRPMTQNTPTGAYHAQWQANHPTPATRSPQLAQAAPPRDAARTAPSTDRGLFNGDAAHPSWLRRR